MYNYKANYMYIHMCEQTLASFPGLPCFYLPFAFTITHGSGRPAKNGEGLGAFMMSGGCEVDVGEQGPNTKTMHCIIR